jgi:uroporphyrinogen decarboxylase
MDQWNLHLPEGMKLMVIGPGGVLENAIRMMGYETLCEKLYEDPKLVEAVFERVGQRVLQYYESALPYEAVGGLILNDDWGFNTQPFLSPQHMRRYVFPWHKKIVEKAHLKGKPAILHSCGNTAEIMDDIIDDIKFDAKHSFEDVICPVEDMYEKYHARIAILGGIDIGFLCRETPEAIYKRSKAMLERTRDRGGYALGTGNSVPEYIPRNAYFAMISAATGRKF